MNFSNDNYNLKLDSNQMLQLVAGNPVVLTDNIWAGTANGTDTYINITHTVKIVKVVDPLWEYVNLPHASNANKNDIYQHYTRVASRYHNRKIPEYLLDHLQESPNTGMPDTSHVLSRITSRLNSALSSK